MCYIIKGTFGELNNISRTSLIKVYINMTVSIRFFTIKGLFSAHRSPAGHVSHGVLACLFSGYIRLV